VTPWEYSEYLGFFDRIWLFGFGVGVSSRLKPRVLEVSIVRKNPKQAKQRKKTITIARIFCRRFVIYQKYITTVRLILRVKRD
jgi:hypothetical protein